MRYGCCTCMGTSDPWGIGYEQIPMLERLGFDFVEMPLAAMVQMPRDAFEQHVLETLQQSSIPCYACNLFFPGSLRLTGPEVSREATREYLEKSIAVAAAVGAKVIVFGSGGARNLPEGFPKAEGYTQLGEMLAVAGPIAAQHGIRIAIEPLNRMESNIINSYQSGLYLAALSGQENVGSLVDYYHFAVGNEPLESLMVRMPVHVHIAQPLGRLLPTSARGAEYTGFFAALRAAGYGDGAVSLEGGTQGDTEAHLAASLAFVRSL